MSLAARDRSSRLWVAIRDQTCRFYIDFHVIDQDFTAITLYLWCSPEHDTEKLIIPEPVLGFGVLKTGKKVHQLKECELAKNWFIAEEPIHDACLNLMGVGYSMN